MISRARRFIPFLLFRRIRLRACRHAIGVAQLEPDQIASGIDLIRFVQCGDRGLVVFRVARRRSCLEFFVQRTDGLVFSGCFGSCFLLGFQLFWRHPLRLGLRGRLFLQIDILRGFLEADRYTVKRKKLLAILAQLYVVFAGDNPERKILAFVVGLELVGVP